MWIWDIKMSQVLFYPLQSLGAVSLFPPEEGELMLIKLTSLWEEEHFSVPVFSLQHYKLSSSSQSKKHKWPFLRMLESPDSRDKDSQVGKDTQDVYREGRKYFTKTLLKVYRFSVCEYLQQLPVKKWLPRSYHMCKVKHVFHCTETDQKDRILIISLVLLLITSLIGCHSFSLFYQCSHSLACNLSLDLCHL